MKNKEAEYKEIFLAEALSNFEEINRLLVELERDASDKNTIHALFRITHTLKGNAAGMGYTAIAEMAHVLEDLFGEVRDGRIRLDRAVFPTLYKGVDALGLLIQAVREDKTEDVRYKGIKTKLQVWIKSAERENAASTEKDILPEAIKTPDLNLSPFALEPEKDLKDPCELNEESAPGEVDAKISFSDLVQVPVRKLDNLLTLVGELIIEKDRLLAGLHGGNEYARLNRISSDLQYSIMDVRLVQVGFLFNKFHRVVRDAASQENKNVSLRLEGTDTEIDRNVLQVISDSLIHLIRNCVAHGIEDTESRAKAGKPAEGTVLLSARNETDAVVIEINDDGKGLDYEKIRNKALHQSLITKEMATVMTEDELAMLIFEPGFSTVEQVTAISGRGVGMDVVRQTVDSIGGTVQVISTPGKGTTIQLKLPSSMAVKSCLLFKLGGEVYAIPLSYTESVISLYKNNIHKAGSGLVATHLDTNITVVFLKDIFNRENVGSQPGRLQNALDTVHPEQKLEIVVVTFNGKRIGFVVDKLLQQKEIVEKPLTKPIDHIKFVSGVTILGTGQVCLVLNIPYIVHFILNPSAHDRSNQKLSDKSTLV